MRLTPTIKRAFVEGFFCFLGWVLATPSSASSLGASWKGEGEIKVEELEGVP